MSGSRSVEEEPERLCSGAGCPQASRPVMEGPSNRAIALSPQGARKLGIYPLMPSLLGWGLPLRTELLPPAQGKPSGCETEWLEPSYRAMASNPRNRPPSGAGRGLGKSSSSSIGLQGDFQLQGRLASGVLGVVLVSFTNSWHPFHREVGLNGLFPQNPGRPVTAFVRRLAQSELVGETWPPFTGAKEKQFGVK